MAEDAVGCEPVSAPNSLLTGKLTGNLPISGVSAANLTTSLRACARPDRATWAACRRRRGDRVVFLLRLLTAAIGTSRHFAATQHFGRVLLCAASFTLSGSVIGFTIGGCQEAQTWFSGQGEQSSLSTAVFGTAIPAARRMHYRASNPNFGAPSSTETSHGTHETSSNWLSSAGMWS